MSHDQFALLSNQAVAACAVVYFLAFLAHLVQRASLRSAVPARAAEVEVREGATNASITRACPSVQTESLLEPQLYRELVRSITRWALACRVSPSYPGRRL